MTRPLSTEQISDLIGSIYDCVLDPGAWEDVLIRICEDLELANAQLGVLRLPTGLLLHETMVGYPADWLARAPGYSEDVVALWGGPLRLQSYPLDEPIIQSEVAGRDVMESNRYFRELVAPHGVIDAVGFAVMREAETVGNVAFGRHGSRGPIDAQVVDGLRLLAPHIRRAVTIGNLFDMRAIEAAAFRSTLDGVPCGVMLVDEDLRILTANSAADTMLGACGSLRSEGGMLRLQQPSAEADLREAVMRAARDEATIGRKGLGVLVRGGGEASLLHVLPLQRGVTRAGLASSAVAAVFATTAARPLHMPLDGIAPLYDLTPAEARVFELICEGAALRAIAAELGVARSTVKTHLDHIFEKTGCRRQADLVRLAAGFSL